MLKTIPPKGEGLYPAPWKLNLNKDDAHYMASILRSGVVEKKAKITLSDEVECDEVYIIAGHKGNSAAVKKRNV